MIRPLARRDDLLLLADPQAGPGAILYSDDSDAEPRVVNAETAWGLSYWQPTTEPLPVLPPAIVQELADYNASHAPNPALDEVRSMAADDADDETITDSELDDLIAGLRESELAEVRRALGHDTHPGGEKLRRYWTESPEGLAKWAESPRPWTTLVSHLVKFMNPEMAKRVAADWFHRVFHFWPGSDENRVTHGQPPRGHRVGPG